MELGWVGVLACVCVQLCKSHTCLALECSMIFMAAGMGHERPINERRQCHGWVTEQSDEQWHMPSCSRKIGSPCLPPG